jgi:hypothetical protein
VVVEPALDGAELTVCCTVEAGRVRSWFAARREYGRPLLRESRQYLVDAVADQLGPELTDFVARAHAALGIRQGVTHLDLVLTGEGPKVAGAGCWLAGDLIPLLGCMATGVDLATAAVQLAVGRPVRERIEYRRAAGIRLVLPAGPAAGSGPGRVRVLDRPDGTVVVRSIDRSEVEYLAPAGELSSVALLAATAADGAGCRAALDAAATEEHPVVPAAAISAAR